MRSYIERLNTSISSSSQSRIRKMSNDTKMYEKNQEWLIEKKKNRKLLKRKIKNENAKFNSPIAKLYTQFKSKVDEFAHSDSYFFIPNDDIFSNKKVLKTDFSDKFLLDDMCSKPLFNDFVSTPVITHTKNNDINYHFPAMSISDNINIESSDLIK